MKFFLTLSWNTIRTVFSALLETNARRALVTLAGTLASAFGTELDPEYLTEVLALVALVFTGLAVKDKIDASKSNDLNFSNRQDGDLL